MIVGAFELRQLVTEKGEYFKQYNNLNDILFFLTFWCYFACDYYIGSTKEDHEDYEITRILMSVLIISGFAKLMSLNRVNSNISFIVQMVLKVSVAILPFLTLFVSLIITFAFIVHTLGINFKTQDEENPYRKIGALGYFLFIFRTSTGDFDVDNFSELSLSL
mgnify:CR=1 FL=1